MLRSCTKLSSASPSAISRSTFSAISAVPPLPGATYSTSVFGDFCSAHAMACSRPPEPISRMFTFVPFLALQQVVSYSGLLRRGRPWSPLDPDRDQHTRTNSVGRVDQGQPLRRGWPQRRARPPGRGAARSYAKCAPRFHEPESDERISHLSEHGTPPGGTRPDSR